MFCAYAQVTGLGFSLNITASVYNLAMGVIAAKSKDFTTHRRHVVQMVGLAYGVFPFKYIWILILAVTSVLSGDWLYGVSIWLSTVTGVLVTNWAFLGKLPAKDAAHDRNRYKTVAEAGKNQ